MCTSLLYTDAAGAAYAGRTMEFMEPFPWRGAYLPAGIRVRSHPAPGVQPRTFTTTHRILAMTGNVETSDAWTVANSKIVEGLNDAGLSFSLLSFADAAGPAMSATKTLAALSALDLGSWTLGQFATVAEVKAALRDQPVLLAPVLNVFGPTNAPFHYVLHDRSGATIVIEFAAGKQTIYDDPVGVMTNGPELSWHLTNLNNYTYLSNVDRSTNQFGTLRVSQPDFGIATSGLPASNTSVGRFVRAVYYAQYVHKAASPDEAIVTLAHIMNNFDRPLDATIDFPTAANEGAYSSEYTQFTALCDLNRGVLCIRSSDSINYTRFEMAALATTTKITSLAT